LVLSFLGEVYWFYLAGVINEHLKKQKVPTYSTFSHGVL
jgi:triacylglycerol esterase/lipase EstA (alpha/beta hydrolase family)